MINRSTIIIEVQDDGSISISHDLEILVNIEVLDYKWSEDHSEDVPFDVYTGKKRVTQARDAWDEFINEISQNNASWAEAQGAYLYHGYDTEKDYHNDHPPEDDTYI
tara:strand:+ start:272 stop:592 length:321 start_codon:yes stop_codon:yes gene_type:complete